MKTETFNKILEDTLDSCKGILCTKAKEYAASDDRLHNFKRAAALASTTPEMALRGMLSKHVVSVWDFIDRTENGEKISPESWDEKTLDVINYMILLRALTLDADKK